MVSTLSQPVPASPQLGTKKADIEENVLTPRFYTTDFDKAANLDLSSQETELKAVLAEMQAEVNSARHQSDIGQGIGLQDAFGARQRLQLGLVSR